MTVYTVPISVTITPPSSDPAITRECIKFTGRFTDRLTHSALWEQMYRNLPNQLPGLNWDFYGVNLGYRVITGQTGFPESGFVRNRDLEKVDLDSVAGVLVTVVRAKT